MARELTIRDRLITDDAPAYTIAEIGSNAHADTALSKQYIRAAALAGADSVKFQRRDNPNLYTKAMLDMPYPGEHSYGATYGEHRAALEYSVDQLATLRDYAHECHVSFGVTAFDQASAKTLACLGVDFLKIASACITDTELLLDVAGYGIPVIISTGTATLHDVDTADAIMRQSGTPFALLQCSAIYPNLDPSTLHLNVISSYRARFPDIVTGLSSHYATSRDATIAYALGGRIFEKHFTLDRSAKGADHSFSMTPAAFSLMVENLEKTRLMLGSPHKTRLLEEQPAIVKMGHSMYAARDLPAGHELKRSSIAIKSPGGFIPPSRLQDYLGRKIPVALAEDEPIPEMKWYEG